MQSACIVSELDRWTLRPGLALRIVDRTSQKGGVLWAGRIGRLDGVWRSKSHATPTCNLANVAAVDLRLVIGYRSGGALRGLIFRMVAYSRAWRRTNLPGSPSALRQVQDQVLSLQKEKGSL